MTEKTFGECDPLLAYDHRTGAYLVIVRDGMVATISHRSGFLLPGGDVEDTETHEECLLRICLETMGYDVRVDELITTADAWESGSASAPVHSIQYYYSGELLDCYTQNAADGTCLCWVPIERLALPMQRYAVRAYLMRETSAAALSFIDGRHHILDGPLSN